MSYYGNRYLTQAESDSNALEVAAILTRLQWTPNAIAGVLGNMYRESGINPGIWQNLDYGNMNGGFGLVQWTPATNYINWATEKGYSTYDEYASIPIQVDRIQYEFENGLQYYSTTSYPITASEFMKSTQTPEYLAEVFLFNYERAGVAALNERKQWATYYYNLIGGTPIDPPVIDPDNPTPDTNTKPKHKFNFVLFNKRRKDQWIGMK